MASSHERGTTGPLDRRELPVLMTVEEVAVLTRRSRSAVVASIQRGEIPAHKAGSRRWWIRRDEFLDMFGGGYERN